MDSTRTSPAGAASVRPLWVLICVLLVGYAAWLVWVPSAQPWRDLFLYTTILLACSLAVLLRARSEPVDRAPWLILGVGLLIWAASDALYTANVQAGEATFPSLPDWGYLAFFPFAYVAVGLLVVRHVARSAIGVWLDGILVALTVGAFLSLMIPQLSAVVEGDPVSVFMQFATPASDLLLLSGLIGVVGLLGRQTAPMWWALVGAAALLWATDSLWLLGVANDQYHVGVPLDLGWLFAFVLFAAAAWLPVPSRTVVEDRAWAPLAAVAGGGQLPDAAVRDPAGGAVGLGAARRRSGGHRSPARGADDEGGIGLPTGAPPG